jgi:hypothetical protein
MSAAKLARLSVCPCGFPSLYDDIELGTEYRVYLESIRTDFSYRCGKCGRLQQGVSVILADQRCGDGRAYLPLALFDLSGISA